MSGARGWPRVEAGPAGPLTLPWGGWELRDTLGLPAPERERGPCAVTPTFSRLQVARGAGRRFRGPSPRAS